MTAHCRFATYTWTLCDALLVRHLRSPSWIRGIQKAGAAAPAAAGQIIEAEGGQYVTGQQLHQLLALYSELWQGEFWDFLKKEMVCLAHNHMVPQAFHALQTCCMMAMETPGREAYYDRWLAIMEGEKGILQKGRDYMCQFHQQMTWHLLGEVM